MVVLDQKGEDPDDEDLMNVNRLTPPFVNHFHDLRFQPTHIEYEYTIYVDRLLAPVDYLRQRGQTNAARLQLYTTVFEAHHILTKVGKFCNARLHITTA